MRPGLTADGTPCRTCRGTNTGSKGCCGQLDRSANAGPNTGIEAALLAADQAHQRDVIVLPSTASDVVAFPQGAASCDIGNVRKQNQDSVRVGERSWVLCDGMGGHANGAMASKLAADATIEALERVDEPTPESMRAALLEGDAAIKANSSGALLSVEQMSATTVAAARLSDGSLVGAFVGDSPAIGYASLPDGTFEQRQLCTDDRHCGFFGGVHSSIGMLHRGFDDVGIFELRGDPGSRLLLCSDGLTNAVDAAVIDNIMTNAPSEAAAVRQLRTAALQTECSDNVSIIVLSS